MNQMRFAKCPTWWVRDGLLREGFKGGASCGESIAGLKIIIAISQALTYETLEATLSFTDFEKHTGLSRPMVAKGIKLVESYGIIEVISTTYRNTYRMIEKADKNGKDGWAKLPIMHLKYELKSIPNRGVAVLHALKFYLQLLASRPNITNVMHMTYDTIKEKVGTNSKDIRPSIDILFNHNLISVAKEAAFSGTGGIEYLKNKYTINGL